MPKKSICYHDIKALKPKSAAARSLAKCRRASGNGIQKLTARIMIADKFTQHTRRTGGGLLLADTAHHHAHMAGIHHHGNTATACQLFDGGGDLFGQVFLDL